MTILTGGKEAGPDPTTREACEARANLGKDQGVRAAKETRGDRSRSPDLQLVHTRAAISCTQFSKTARCRSRLRTSANWLAARSRLCPGWRTL